jgi:hypothetical protein
MVGRRLARHLERARLCRRGTSRRRQHRRREQVADFSAPRAKSPRRPRSRGHDRCTSPPPSTHGVGDDIASRMDMKLAIGVHRETWPLGPDLLRIERLLMVVRLIHSWGRQTLCATRGHDMLLRYEPGRLSLRCPSCGAETPGWRIDVSPRFRIHRSPVLARPRIRHNSQAS